MGVVLLASTGPLLPGVNLTSVPAVCLVWLMPLDLSNVSSLTWFVYYVHVLRVWGQGYLVSILILVYYVDILVCTPIQLSEATLYAAGLELMEACIKRLTSMGAFEDEVRIMYTCIPSTNMYSNDVCIHTSCKQFHTAPGLKIECTTMSMCHCPQYHACTTVITLLPILFW